MRPKLLLFLLIISISALAAPPAGKQVSYPSGDEAVHGILYTPAGNGPFPAIVVVHEWWGLNDWVKEQAQKLTGQGYVTLALDLYRGKVTADPEEAHELMRGLPEDRATRDLLAAVKFLKSQKDVNPKKIGSIGWCMGGGWSLKLAESDPTLAADVVNYGMLPADAAALKPIHAPVLGLFGAQDRGIPPEAVQRFAKNMKSLGKSVEVKDYADAGHAFENPNNKQGYRPQDAADAWQRTVAFFAAHLKK